MRISATAGGNTSVATAPSINRSTFCSNRISIGSFFEKLLAVIGRLLLRLPPSAWLLVDLSTLSIGVWIAFSIYPPPALLETPHVALWQALATFAFAVTIASLVFGLYERETFLSRSKTVTRMVLATAVAAIVAYGIIYVVMYSTVARRISAVTLSVFLVGGTTIRLGAWWAVHRIRRGLIVVGGRPLFESFQQAQREGLLNEYRLLGYTYLGREKETVKNDLDRIGPITSLPDQLASLGVCDLVVGDTAAHDAGVMEWMVPCLQKGCRVTTEATFYEKATGQILVDEITPSWFLLADLKVHCEQQATFKRLLDLATSIVGLCLTAPVWPLIALAIKLGDGGPVFYSQDRVGHNGRIFRLYKFRTMRPDAENGKSVWCSPQDPRVTRVGRFLRRTRLDELPQLYNVLVGQMSIVGPRPERPDIVQDLREQIPFYAERHLVKPGVTGWAQISFRYGASVEDSKRKLQFDLYYLKNMSFELDMIILFRTVGTFLRGAC